MTLIDKGNSRAMQYWHNDIIATLTHIQKMMNWSHSSSSPLLRRMHHDLYLLSKLDGFGDAWSVPGQKQSNFSPQSSLVHSSFSGAGWFSETWFVLAVVKKQQQSQPNQRDKATKPKQNNKLKLLMHKLDTQCTVTTCSVIVACAALLVVWMSQLGMTMELVGLGAAGGTK